jgi:Tfp pilus assembly protein FimV
MAGSGLPDRKILEQVQSEVSDVLATGAPALVKKLYAALITKLTVAAGRVVQPELRVPAAKLHLQSADADVVRMPLPSVRPPGLEPGT